ncbi:hypothetical protein M2454_002338 [Aequitasia blattaphilus]|uniref:Uncharacterized protein n=1 Tax=Aequitasia blattaphilus TaxID=2949332 RepID=A0ABT1EBD9_9FIRM|nr:hypothetical protein [Aequitasia blattaphilus]MCP1103148.1 hypothetical protein [Aequitasia blattaphilus]MCR8615788.1 hypothetical protein [Aequitasia blattaphilus]
MCRVPLRMKRDNTIDYIIYSLVSSKSRGRFTIEFVSEELRKANIDVPEKRIVDVVDKWVDDGIVYDNRREYVFSSAQINYNAELLTLKSAR